MDDGWRDDCGGCDSSGDDGGGVCGAMAAVEESDAVPS